MKKPYTLDYFRDECHRFREITGSTKYTFDEMNRAFGALFYCVVNVRQEDQSKAGDLWRMIALEWRMKMPYIAMHPKVQLTRGVSAGGQR